MVTYGESEDSLNGAKSEPEVMEMFYILNEVLVGW